MIYFHDYSFLTKILCRNGELSKAFYTCFPLINCCFNEVISLLKIWWFSRQYICIVMTILRPKFGPNTAGKRYTAFLFQIFSSRRSCFIFKQSIGCISCFVDFASFKMYLNTFYNIIKKSRIMSNLLQNLINATFLKKVPNRNVINSKH